MLIAWREPNARGEMVITGTCIEVSRDEASTAALTLCGQAVTLPGSAIPGMRPTCPACKKKRATRTGNKS